jgi:hypothetical protein
MATDQRTLPGTFTVDADFRSWGSGLSAQFAAIGLVKTSDTGQIDWTTVLKPSGSNIKMGYEIWRFNDALQATKPVFIRIDFGSGLSTNYPGLWVTVGTATNGAGTLTGQVGATRPVPANSTTTGPTYCSGSSSRLNLASNTGAGASFLLISVERTKTGAGVDTGDGIVRYANSSAQGLGYQLVPFVGTIPAEATSNPALDSNLGGVSSLGPDVMLSPTVAFYGKPLFASWCIYKNTEITGLTPITFTHLGATRTYMPLGGNSVSASNNLQTTGGYAIAMLWE